MGCSCDNSNVTVTGLDQSSWVQSAWTKADQAFKKLNKAGLCHPGIENDPNPDNFLICSSDAMSQARLEKYKSTRGSAYNLVFSHPTFLSSETELSIEIINNAKAGPILGLVYLAGSDNIVIQAGDLFPCIFSVLTEITS